MLKPAAIILVCAVSAGWLAGRAWSSAGEGNSAKKPVVEVPQIPERTVKKEAPRKRQLGQAEFLAELREYSAESKKPGFSPLKDVLADWTDEELIAALEESIKDPARHGMPGDDGNATLFLLSEWMGRDLDAAAKWVVALDSALVKKQLAPEIARCWPPDRVDEGMAFLMANKGIFQAGEAWPIITMGFNKAAAEGVAAVSAVLQNMTGNDLAYIGVKVEFPPGFDFKALAAAGQLEGATLKHPDNPVVLAWAKLDRDAAFQWTLENVGADRIRPQLLGVPGEGQVDFTWTAGRYEQMDEGQRTKFWESAAEFLGADLLHIPSLTQAMKDPALKEELWLQGVQGIFLSRPGAMSTAEDSLRSLEPPERRLEILENLERQPIPAYAGGWYVPVDEVRLRYLLDGWTPDRSRIDSIIKHLKQ